MANKPQPIPPVTQGPMNRAPCPNCGKPNNFTGHGEMLEMNGVFECDHCHQMMQVVAVQTIKIIQLRKPVGQVSSVRPRR